jgi:putrescine transport system ATP-binding protein
MMFQSYALFPHMNVEQNIAYGLKRDHLPTGEIAERVAELLGLVKLQDYGKRRPHQLSGGQRQRVALLARSLAKRPEAAAARRAARRARQEAARGDPVRAGEDPGNAGRYLHRGDPRPGGGNVARHPHRGDERRRDRHDRRADRHLRIPQFALFVAGFVGSVNMAEGVVVEDEPDHVRIRSAELGCDIHVGHGVDCAPDQILWWAIRPEKIQLSREQAGRPRTGPT